MRIRLLQAVGNDPKGSVLEIPPDRADRVRKGLIRTGYAVELVEPSKKVKHGRPGHSRYPHH